MTTAATDTNNTDPPWSNFGSCVDIWAWCQYPVNLPERWHFDSIGNFDVNPHAAGAAALYLSSHLTATPASVELTLKTVALRPGTRSNNGQAITLVYAGGFYGFIYSESEVVLVCVAVPLI